MDVCRVGQNHTCIGIYGVHTVFLAGKSPYIGHIRCVYTVLANPRYLIDVIQQRYAQLSRLHHLPGLWPFNISQASHHQIMHSTVNSITCQVDGHSLLNRRHTIKSCTAQSTPSPARSMAIQYFTGVTPSNHAQHSQLHHLPGRWPFNISQASHE